MSHNLLLDGPECGRMNDFESGMSAVHEAELRRSGRKVDVMSDAEYKRQALAAALPRQWDRVFKNEVGRREAFFRHFMVPFILDNLKAESHQQDSYKRAVDSYCRAASKNLAIYQFFLSQDQVNVDPPLNLQKKEDIIAKFGSLGNLVFQKLEIAMDETKIETVYEATRGRKKPGFELVKDYLNEESKHETIEPGKTILSTLIKDAKLRDKIILEMDRVMMELNPLVEQTAAIRREASQQYAVDNAEGLKERYKIAFEQGNRRLKQIIPEEKGKALIHDGISYAQFKVEG